ncbi:MAG TPA: O-methyltransferase [bacterium]|nr:O-methyltransferase [bacterium]
MDILHKAINQYIEDRYRDQDSVLAEMEAYGQKRDFPLVGPQVGRLFFILTKLLKPKRVFEMGSGYGYSAYWFAKALADGGTVYQTEYAEENSLKAREFFEKGGLTPKTEFLVGDALDLIDAVDGQFDIIFIDMDKKNYPAAFEKSKKRLNPGGLFMADNTLWFGKVLDRLPDEDTRGILKFTELLFKDPDFSSTIVPVRDGVAIGYKLK